MSFFKVLPEIQLYPCVLGKHICMFSNVSSFLPLISFLPSFLSVVFHSSTSAFPCMKINFNVKRHAFCSENRESRSSVKSSFHTRDCNAAFRNEVWLWKVILEQMLNLSWNSNRLQNCVLFSLCSLNQNAGSPLLLFSMVARLCFHHTNMVCDPYIYFMKMTLFEACNIYAIGRDCVGCYFMVFFNHVYSFIYKFL